jgi:hypothetical protein
MVLDLTELKVFVQLGKCYLENDENSLIPVLSVSHVSPDRISNHKKKSCDRGDQPYFAVNYGIDLGRVLEQQAKRRSLLHMKTWKGKRWILRKRWGGRRRKAGSMKWRHQ